MLCSHLTSVTMALSPLEKAKRAFVSLLLLLARAHGLALGISRESPDPAVLTAFRRVSRKVHPDRGGSLAESQRWNAARDAWDEARRDTHAHTHTDRHSDAHARAQT